MAPELALAAAAAERRGLCLSLHSLQHCQGSPGRPTHTVLPRPRRWWGQSHHPQDTRQPHGAAASQAPQSGQPRQMPGHKGRVPRGAATSEWAQRPAPRRPADTSLERADGGTRPIGLHPLKPSSTGNKKGTSQQQSHSCLESTGHWAEGRTAVADPGEQGQAHPWPGLSQSHHGQAARFQGSGWPCGSEPSTPGHSQQPSRTGHVGPVGRVT